MLSGNPTIEQFDKLLVAFEAALAMVINDQKLKDNQYTNVDIPNEPIKSFARETWNILANIKVFRERILKDSYANIFWVGANGYKKACEIQASGPVMVDKVQLFLKNHANQNLPDQEKSNVKLMLKDSREFLGFFYDRDKKQARAESIDIFLKHLIDAPTIVAVPGFSGLLRKYFDGYQQDGLPKFIEELASVLDALEKLANKQQHQVEAQDIAPEVEKNSKNIELQVLADEKLTPLLPELIEIQDKLQKEFENHTLAKDSFIKINFLQIKTIKSKNEVLLENIRERLREVQEQYYSENSVLIQKKEQLEIKREKLKKEISEQSLSLNELTDNIVIINTKLSNVDALDSKYCGIANKLSAYWFPAYRNDTDVMINDELNQYFDIHQVKTCFGERLGFRFSNADKWTYELRAEWEAFVKHERLMLKSELENKEKRIVEAAQKNVNVLDMLAIEQEISAEQIKIDESDLKVKKAVHDINELILKNKKLQSLLEDLIARINAETKKTILDCKQSIDKYKKKRSTQYAFNDFVEKTTGMAAETFKMEYKPEKEKRKEYLEKLENALDQLGEQPENAAHQHALKKVLEEGRNHTLFKPRVQKAATVQIGVVNYKFTLQSCLDEIEEKSKVLQGSIDGVSLKS